MSTTAPDVARDLIPEDDSWRHHERSDHPLWNESSWFGFCIPERQVNGWFYYWHRPNMGLSAGGVAVWDATGEERHNCLYYHWFDFNQHPGEDGDHFDFKLDNGLHMQLLEPLNEYRGRFKSNGIDLDLTWEGVLPAQPTWRAAGTEKYYAGLHYDQHCHVEGTIEIRGERYTVDCFHARDRSWGPRQALTDLPGGSGEAAYVDADLSFFVNTMRMEPALEPGDEPAVDKVSLGHFVKDGQLSTVASGERRVLSRRADGVPERISVDVRDDAGRELHAEGAVRNCLKYDDLWFSHWCLVEWDVEGRPAWGETQDFLQQELIRRYQRQALGA